MTYPRRVMKHGVVNKTIRGRCDDIAYLTNFDMQRSQSAPIKGFHGFTQRNNVVFEGEAICAGNGAV